MPTDKPIQERSRFKLIRASKALQIKAGTGELDTDLIIKAETVIHNNAEDFQPIAQGFLDRLAKGIYDAYAGLARENKLTDKQLIAGLTQPVMELKANARMFKYDLVTSLANIMLGFLEHIDRLDKDAIDIVQAHHKTLTAIIGKGMKGDGGANGKLFEAELREVCQRYFSRKKK